MDIPLRKFVAPEFVYGTDARNLAAQFIINIGAQRPLVVADPLIIVFPWFKSIIQELENSNLKYTLFTEVSVNPKDIECEAGAQVYLEHECDAILAVGGGSNMDCAKGIGILTANPSPIGLYEGIDEIEALIPPLICIPTTAGSAAEISQFSIITNTKSWYKMAIVSKVLVPDLALIDPVVTLTKDFTLTVDTGLDVLAHGVESYVSNAASPFTQIHALEAIKLVIQNLPKLSVDLDSLPFRDGMMRASVHAGLSFSNASLGLVHAMAHGLGGRYHLIHGELNGILLPEVVRYNYPGAPKAYDTISTLFCELLGYEPAPIWEQIKRFSENIRPGRSLSEMGVDTTDLEQLIPWILSDPCNVTNPVSVTRESVMLLYDKIR